MLKIYQEGLWGEFIYRVRPMYRRSVLGGVCENRLRMPVNKFPQSPGKIFSKVLSLCFAGCFLTLAAGSVRGGEILASTEAAGAQVRISTVPGDLSNIGLPLSDVARTIGLGREEYVYSVEWGVLKVGKATLGSPEVVKVGEKDAYHIVSTARTLPFFDTFYRVRDKNDSWLDAKTFVSLGFGKYLREGRFFRDETVVFNHETGTLKATIRRKKGGEKVEEGVMKPYAYDVLSALYWLRAQPLAVGREFVVDVNTRKDWPLLIKVAKEERIRVAAGEFDCWVVEPMMRDEGIFVHKGKSMHTWLTKDSRKIPVQIKAEVFIGSVRAELEEIVYKD